MARTTVAVHILPSSFNIKDSTITILQGVSISSLDEILVNRVGNNEYLVVYTDDVFKRLDVKAFAENLINTFRINMPGVQITLTIDYKLWKYPETFDEECAITLLRLDSYLEDYPDEELVNYIFSRSVDEIFEAYNEEDGTFNFDPNEDDEHDEWDDSDDDDEIDINPKVLEELAQYLDLDDDSCAKKGKGKKKFYGSSRVLKSIKNPKKYYKRHGIIVATDKSALKKDEKIIRDFLKDFIPGKAGWIKDYREEVLERFMRMYAISKKSLKKLEKHHRKQRGKKSKDGNKISKEKAMNFTRNLFNKDSWSNPNK